MLEEINRQATLVRIKHASYITKDQIMKVEVLRGNSEAKINTTKSALLEDNKLLTITRPRTGQLPPVRGEQKQKEYETLA